jgi:hypothetical protein
MQQRAWSAALHCTTCGVLPRALYDTDLIFLQAARFPHLHISRTHNATMSGSTPPDLATLSLHKPKDALGAATNALFMTGGAGLFVSAIQNSLQRQNVGAFGVFTKSGGTIATSSKAASGAAYAFTKTAVGNLREEEDSWNQAIGGFVGGAMLGLRGIYELTVLAVWFR